MKEEEEEKPFVSRDKRRHVWSDDASAEKTNGRERVVGFDCEERRYLF